MEKIRDAAVFCTGRAVMFGSIAIATIMMSFAFDLALSLKAGAILTLMMAGILILKGFSVPRQNPKRTEVWIYLTPDTKPAGEHALRIFRNILRDVYFLFARGAFYVACGFFAASMVLRGAI